MCNLSSGGHINCARGRIWSPKRLTLIEACKRHPLKHINCWVQVWDKTLDSGCRQNSHSMKLIRYLAIPAFNGRCQYCTSSIKNITYAEHLITCKSNPHSPEHICSHSNFEDSVFRPSKVISNLLFSLHTV